MFHALKSLRNTDLNPFDQKVLYFFLTNKNISLARSVPFIPKSSYFIFVSLKSQYRFLKLFYVHVMFYFKKPLNEY